PPQAPRPRAPRLTLRPRAPRLKPRPRAPRLKPRPRGPRTAAPPAGPAPRLPAVPARRARCPQPSTLDLQLGRLLRLVRVLRASVDLQLRELLASEAVAREHSLDRETDDLLGPSLEHLAEGPRAQSAGITAVSVVELVV